MKKTRRGRRAQLESARRLGKAREDWAARRQLDQATVSDSSSTKSGGECESDSSNSSTWWRRNEAISSQESDHSKESADPSTPLQSVSSMSSSSSTVLDSELDSSSDESECLAVALPNTPALITLDQLDGFIYQINQSSACTVVRGCEGKLIPIDVKLKRQGGGCVVDFVCSGCRQRKVVLRSSAQMAGGKQSVIGQALALAFIVSGHGYCAFEKTMRQSLGVRVLGSSAFSKLLEKIYPIAKTMLTEMCSKAKDEMKAIQDDVIGSWKRAVVTADGVWITRGHHSQHGSFIVKNYMTGGLLWYGHKCQRGKDAVAEEELFQGTSKSMEGILAETCYSEARREGCTIEVLWQDADSSSEKAFHAVFPETVSKVFRCAGHIGRAHGKRLQEMMEKKTVTETFKKNHRVKFPAIDSVKCCCLGGKHSSTCGCIREDFIRAAKINHFAAVKSALNDPSKYTRTMNILGKYHARNIHAWGGETCGFHPVRQCTCNSCKPDEIKCDGKPYSSKATLTCPFHALLYEIECCKRAGDAEVVIHPEMGKGHTNLCESSFSVLPHFRHKSSNIHRLHYVTSTNLGLLQANMTWASKSYRSDYSWVADLYRRMGLPVFDGMIDALKRARKKKEIAQNRKKMSPVKAARIKRKKERVLEAESRKKWVKARGGIEHDYGDKAEEEEDETSERPRRGQKRTTRGRKKTTRPGKKAT